MNMLVICSGSNGNSYNIIMCEVNFLWQQAKSDCMVNYHKAAV